MTFQVVNGSDSALEIHVMHEGQMKAFSPVQIASMIMAHLKHAAEVYLGAPVSCTVLTVPAFFDDAQRSVEFTFVKFK